MSLRFFISLSLGLNCLNTQGQVQLIIWSQTHTNTDTNTKTQCYCIKYLFLHISFSHRHARYYCQYAVSLWNDRDEKSLLPPHLTSHFLRISIPVEGCARTYTAHFQTLTKKDCRWISKHERMADSPVCIEILFILDASATVLYNQRQQLVLVGGAPFFCMDTKNEWFAGWGGGRLASMLVTEVQVFLSQTHWGCFSFFNLVRWPRRGSYLSLFTPYYFRF